MATPDTDPALRFVDLVGAVTPVAVEVTLSNFHDDPTATDRTLRMLCATNSDLARAILLEADRYQQQDPSRTASDGVRYGVKLLACMLATQFGADTNPLTHLFTADDEAQMSVPLLRLPPAEA